MRHIDCLDIRVATGVWQTLRVDFTGDEFVVTFNGAKLIEAKDTAFPMAGKLGVWTRADSVTLFDDFTWGGK